MKTNHIQPISKVTATASTFPNTLKRFAHRTAAGALVFSAMVLRKALAVGLVAALFAVSVSDATDAASECRPAWSETPTPPGSNSFYAVVALARDDVWGVGSRYDGVDDRPVAEHFDGGQWVTVTVPAPGGACLSSRSWWVVWDGRVGGRLPDD
jgi:hypothetical protein